MAKVLPIITEKAPAPTVKPVQQVQPVETRFHNFVFDELWDADIELESSQGDDTEFAFQFGYINALRRVAVDIFDYPTETLDKWTPNYIQYDNGE